MELLQSGKKVDVREFLNGQRLSDQGEQNRLNKKLDVVQAKLEEIRVKRKDGAGRAREQKQNKVALARNIEFILQKVEEKGFSFSSVPRSQLQEQERKLKEGPPIGVYYPKYELLEAKVFASLPFASRTTNPSPRLGPAGEEPGRGPGSPLPRETALLD